MNMIKIYEQSGKTFVWDAEDAHELRTKHRIVGSLVGCFPKLPFQNSHKYLPLLLMPEESSLASEKGIAEILSNLSVEKIPETSLVKEYWKRRERLCDDQIKKLKELRVKMILEKADVIYEGKKKKLASGQDISSKRKKQQKDSNDDNHTNTEEECKEKMHGNKNSEEVNPNSYGNSSSVMQDKHLSNAESKVFESCASFDEKQSATSSIDDQIMEQRKSSEMEKDCEETDAEKNAVIHHEIAKVSYLNQENCLVQLFTACPWKNEGDYTSRNWHFPRTSHEKLRYAVFKDMWEKGYYLTSGTKFGGDFLAYAGDPAKFHALFIVLCIDKSQDLLSTDIIIYGRLGNQVKKTMVLASVNEDGSLMYLSLKWVSDIH